MVACIFSGQGLTIGKMRADIMGTSDEDSLNDNASIISIASDTTIVEDGKYLKTCHIWESLVFCTWIKIL